MRLCASSSNAVRMELLGFLYRRGSLLPFLLAVHSASSLPAIAEMPGFN